MSSPKEDFDSLSETSAQLKDLHQTMTASDDHPSLASLTGNLRVLINDLQAECPKHRGVLAARVQWYEWLLVAFDETYVRRWMANDLEPVPDHGTADCLFHFMKRGYLKDSFPELFLQLKALYQRAAQYGPTQWAQYFAVKRSQLDEVLLEGRL